MAEPVELESEPSDGDGTDGRYICQYCHDYQGKRASVQAHIRGKTDPAHKGKSGFEKDSEPVPSTGEDKPEHGTEQNSDPTQSRINNENQDTEPEEKPDENDNGVVAGMVIGGMFVVLLWIARQTGNEDELANQIGNRAGNSTDIGDILDQ
jgi:hypothetical protein